MTKNSNRTSRSPMIEIDSNKRLAKCPNCKELTYHRQRCSSANLTFTCLDCGEVTKRRKE